MMRNIPWRNKPTPLISQMIPVSKQLKLYLVNQIGPTNLVLKDQNQNKFKVVIGNTVNCSCGVVKDDHCIHSLFVLLKKFKVSQSNPIIWQASYLDSQLDGMTQYKYQQGGKTKSKMTAKQFLKRKKQVKAQEQDDFPPLEQDQMCAICYQDMNGQCYSTCPTCHKSLHTKCFKVWTKHKEDSNSPVTCPMCRTKFVNPTKMIFQDLQKWQTRFSTHKGTQCKGCGQKNIKGLIFKCLVCYGTDLCKLCYDGNQHLEHQIFFVKQISTDKWKIAPFRIKKTRKQLFQPNQQLNVRQLPNIDSSQFILKLLPTIKQFNAKQAKTELGIVGNELFNKNHCTKCHTQGDDDMIRLTCSHPVHPQCLLSMVQNKQYTCQNDGETICPGYWSAMGVKVNKMMKKPPLDPKFIRNNEQLSLLERKHHSNKVIDPTMNSQPNKKDKSKNGSLKQVRNMSIGLAHHTTNTSTNTKNHIPYNTNQPLISGINRISGMKVLKETISKPPRPNTLSKKSYVQRKLQIQSLSIGGLGFGGSGINGLGGGGMIGMNGLSGITGMNAILNINTSGGGLNVGSINGSNNIRVHNSYNNNLSHNRMGL